MPDLAEHHRLILEGESGITPGLILERGYYTSTDDAHLESLGFNRDQAATAKDAPVLVIPIWGVDREIVGYQLRPDKPRIVDGKALKYESLPNQTPRVDVGPNCAQIDDPAIPLWVTEGIKKADAANARGMVCVALVGVWLWRGTNSKGGSTELADWDRIAIKGRVIFIAFDSDVMQKREVRAALRRLAQVLKRRGAKDVRPVVIPSEGAEKVGLDDFFVGGGTPRDLMDAVDLTILAHSGIITNNRSLADVTAEALDAIIENNIPPSVFVRGGELVRVTANERSVAKIDTLSHSAMRGILARCASWLKAGKNDTSEIAPPKDVVEDVLSLPSWPDIPPIIAITKAPVLAPNGKISMSPGYCPDSRFYVASKEDWPEWNGTVQEAVAFLLGDMLCDFPLKTNADRAHALALMLLPIVRPYILGPTPLHLIDAPVQGTGKSLLATVLLMPTVGGEISATPGTKDEEEWRKKIASSLREGRAYIFFDNLSHKVDSDSLAGVLTSTEWNDRALGSMTNINVPVRCAFVATTNNAELSRDILRRTVWMRLDSGMERPEDGRQFKHQNIEQWVNENRPKIVSALCKIVTHWLDAGQPAFNGRLLGRFEDWGRTIGGILTAAGVDGFLANIDELRAAADSASKSWAEFYERWDNNFGQRLVKAKDLLPEFEAGEDDELTALVAAPDEKGRTVRLGKLLRSRIDRPAGGFKVVRGGDRGGSGTYRLIPTKNGGDFSQDGGVFGGDSATGSDLFSDSKPADLVGIGGDFNESLHAHAHIRAQGEPAADAPPIPTLGSNSPPPTPPNDEVII